MVWTHIILEGYCARDWDKKKKTPRKPSFCPNKPRFICLDKKCLYFAYCDAEIEDYLFLNKRYEEMNLKKKGRKKKLETLQELDNLVSKSKLTKKDVIEFGRKVKKAAAKRYLKDKN